MTTTKLMKTGDTLPVLDVDLQYRDSTQTLDIAVGTPVTFSMRAQDGGALTIDAAAAEVVSSTAGVVRVRYSWAAGDTATAGSYFGEFTFTIGSDTLRAPTAGYVPIVITDHLA